jgi:hypothetical protein
VEHDYLKDGFWAMTRADELPTKAFASHSCAAWRRHGPRTYRHKEPMTDAARDSAIASNIKSIPKKR